MPMYDDEGRLMVSFAGTHPQCIDEYLYHCGDLDTYLRFTDDRIRILVGNVDILDITEAGVDTVVWNEGGVDVDFRWEGVGHPNALFIQGSDGKIGIGTNTIPHGGVGEAILALHGTGSSPTTGPHVQFTTSEDNYPVFLFRPYRHDYAEILFDCYYDGIVSKSSDVGSNFEIMKQGDQFKIRYDSGIAQGANITWNSGIGLDTFGKVFINDAANAKALGPSLTINGKGQDGEYLTLQDSTDVAHGMTALTETDTFGYFYKASPTEGGLLLMGFSEGVLALGAKAYYTTSNTTKNNTGRGPIEFYVAKKSGAAYTDCGADDNVFLIRGRVGAAWRTLFIVDEDGDLLADGGIASTNMVTLYDEYEDAHLVRALDLLRGGKNIIRGYWDKFVKYNEDNLVELGILGDTIGNGGLLNVTGLQRLHNGAIWQNYTGLQETKAIVENHDQKLKIYERAFERISQVLGIPQKELLALTN